jgi:ABC-type uncharacterized transport system ATPase subunit
VELEHISKTFPGGVQANRDITLRIEQGEVHGLLGENGAGKTTLMNILYGLLSKDTGRIKIRGEEVELRSPLDAIHHGVGMVHQHFKLIPTLTVAENVVLGTEPMYKSSNGFFRPLAHAFAHGFLRKSAESWVPSVDRILPMNLGKAAEAIRKLGEENGMPIDPHAKIRDLSVGLQQRVEIIKVLYRKADILILDEPTAVLTPQEVDEFFETLKLFRKQGKTIILITHKLREPMALCDRITVLRDGALVGTVDRKKTSAEGLAEMMVGRPVVFRVSKKEASPKSVVLQLKALQVKDDRGVLKVKGVSLEVRSGEILGLAGVEGNGQNELVEAIIGLRKPVSGEILVDGNRVTGFSPRRVKEAGVGYIPQDRHNQGLILGFTIKENLVLGEHYLPPYAAGMHGLFLSPGGISHFADEQIKNFGIKVRNPSALASTLSGGNQQKLIVARVLGSKPRLLVALQPTRGLDVGATEYIHRLLIEMRDNGVAVFMVSADLDEIRSVSDRIAVIFDGQIVAVRSPAKTDEKDLGLLMAGHGLERASVEAAR